MAGLVAGLATADLISQISAEGNFPNTSAEVLVDKLIHVTHILCFKMHAHST